MTGRRETTGFVKYCERDQTYASKYESLRWNILAWDAEDRLAEESDKKILRVDQGE